MFFYHCSISRGKGHDHFHREEKEKTSRSGKDGTTEPRSITLQVRASFSDTVGNLSSHGERAGACW